MKKITTYIFFSFITLTLLKFAHSELKQIHIVFRHGERAPSKTYPNDPHKDYPWPGGWGQLTNRGKLQMYTLGKNLRELYKYFIPEYYFPEDVKILSSYADRCLMSAESLLAGLFPPKNFQIWKEDLLWQPIPVNYVPRSQDTLIAMKVACKKYDEEFENVFKSGELKQIQEENKELFAYLSEHSGNKIEKIGDAETLYDTLSIELSYNLTLPEWTKNVSMAQMRFLAATSLRSFTESDYMKRMKGGVFLNHTVSLMKGKEKPFVYLYAAHDLTLVNILRTLGYQKVLKPGYGASLIMEYSNNTQIKMLYRDEIESEAEEILPPNCKEQCTLENFEKDFQLYLPKNWEEECRV